MEGNEEEKISTVEIIILVLIVSLNSLFKVVADFCNLIPIIGQVIFMLAEAYSVFAWAAVIIYFIIKLGAFGTIGMVITVGGVLDMLGLPVGLAACTLIAIYLANHPEAAAVAQMATGKPGAAAGKEIAGAGVAAEKAGAAAARAETAGAKALSETGMGGERIAQAETAASRAGTAETAEGVEGKISQRPAGEERPVTEENLGAQEEPIDKLRKLLEEMPEPEAKPEAEEEGDETEK